MIRVNVIGAPLFVFGVLAAGLGASAEHAQNASDIPPGVHWESVAFDTDESRLLLFGGGRAGAGYLQGTWQWDGRRWRVVAAAEAGPRPRHAHAMGYDPAGRRIVLFGGVTDEIPRGPAPAEQSSSLCDTWAFAGHTWTLLNDGPCVTDRTGQASIVYDTRRQSLLLLDGQPSPPRDLGLRPLRIWRLSGTSWELVNATGPRWTSGDATYDEAREVLVVLVMNGPDAGVWEWNGESWRHVAAQGPGARKNYGLAYDARTRRVMLIGGLAENPRRFLSDQWLWDGETWTELPNTGRLMPGPRSHATLLGDPTHDRLLYFGGTADGKLLQDLWLHDRDGWKLWGS